MLVELQMLEGSRGEGGGGKKKEKEKKQAWSFSFVLRNFLVEEA